jgi:hypothetical protein
VSNGGDVRYAFDEGEKRDDRAIWPVENDVWLKSILLKAVSAEELSMLQISFKMGLQ